MSTENVTISAAELRVLQEQLAQANARIAELTKPADAPPPEFDKPKAYFSHVPFFKFHVMTGPAMVEEHQFIAGRFETKNRKVAEFLDAIVDRAGSGVVSKNPDHVEDEVLTMRADLQAAAEKAHNRMVASGMATA